MRALEALVVDLEEALEMVGQRRSGALGALLGPLSSSVSALMRVLISAWRCSVPLCLGMVRSISRRQSSLSLGSRARR
jgi:hypothetical protein